MPPKFYQFFRNFLEQLIGHKCHRGWKCLYPRAKVPYRAGHVWTIVFTRLDLRIPLIYSTCMNSYTIATCCNLFRKFLRMIPQRMMTFFGTVYTVWFFRSSLLMIKRGDLAYQNTFFWLNSVPLCRTWTQLNLILSVLLPKFTHVTAISRRYVIRSLKHGRRKNRSRAQGHSLICFNVICLFCRIIRRWLQKKIATCSSSLLSKLLYSTKLLDMRELGLRFSKQQCSIVE